VTSTNTNIFVHISWSTPVLTGSDTISGYRVYIADSLGNYILESTYCNGLTSPVFTQKYCDVPMTVLRASPFNLIFDSYVYAKIESKNQFGYSILMSPANTAGGKIQTEPAAVVGLGRGTSTSVSQVELTWTEITTYANNHGAGVISYNIQWDAGTNQINFYDIAGYLSLYPNSPYLQTTGVQAGYTYYFRIRALNFWGYGPFSTPFKIKASTAPDLITAVTTSIYPSDGGVLIQWTAPSSNSDPITKYLIQLRDITDSYWVSSTYCDGTSPSIISTLSCVVPMAELIAAAPTYTALTYNTLVVV
jgi:hypothetical protein